MIDTSGTRPDRLMEMAWGYAAPVVVATAVELRVFDHLDGRPRSLEELTALTGGSSRGLRILLRALTGLGLVCPQASRFGLTSESAAYLVRGKAEYRGGLFRHHVQELLPRWRQLAEVVRTGRPVDWTGAKDEAGGHYAAFVEALFPGAFPAAQALGEHLGLASADRPVRVLDVGAGSGVWGIALAGCSAQVRVRAVDLAEVIAITRRVVEEHGLAERFEYAAGDYFGVDLGADHDVAVLGNILHSEGPDGNRQLLTRVRDALRPGGVVAIQEFLPDEDRSGPVMPLLFAVNMLVNTDQGDTYTFAEIRAWLRECGFDQVRQLAVPAVSPLILANRT